MIETIKKVEVTYSPDALLEQYRDSLSSPYDRTLITVEGFYRDRKGKMYGKGHYYDSLLHKETGTELTLEVNRELKLSLFDGGFFRMQGFLNRRRRSNDDSSVSLVYHVLKVEESEKKRQLISEEDYQIIKGRYDRGLANVESLLLEIFRTGKTPTVLLFTGEDSEGEHDFYAHMKFSQFYTIEVKKVNLSSQSGLIEELNKLEKDSYDVMSFVRGGGVGLAVFDGQELSQKALGCGIPFITAIGHSRDNTLLQKVADKGLATPTALASFLDSIVEHHTSFLEDLEEKDTELGDIRAELKSRVESLEAEHRRQMGSMTTKIKHLRLVAGGAILIVIFTIFLFSL